MDKKQLPIGFFDSGVGGLSVMREALKLMPNENYIYFGDSKNAPYGVRELDDVKRLTFNAVEFLLSKGAKAIVIACNTATSAAISDLREKYKDIPIIGIEPAIKPAVELHRDGDIMIMATPFTLKNNKFKNLMDNYKKQANIKPIPCDGLVEFIEKGELDSKELKEYLKDRFKEYRNKDIAAIVLGCTHYPFIEKAILEVLDKDIPIIHGGEGTARELKRKLEELDIINDSNKKGTVEFYNSREGDELINLSKKLINM